MLFPHYEEPFTSYQEVGKFCGSAFESGGEGGDEGYHTNNLEVNKTNQSPSGMPAQELFRNGTVGDWCNYLTSEMVER